MKNINDIIRGTLYTKTKFFSMFIIGLLFVVSFFGFFIDLNLCHDSNTSSTETLDKKSDISSIETARPANCAGGIVTGTVVKNGRSIFWKNRHMNGENEKPRFEHGPVFDYWMNTGGTWGMNEAGLALGNFAQSGTLDNWEFYSDASMGQCYQIQSYLLGHFDTISDAAYYAAYHMGGKSSLGIVSAEPGVGAVVYSGTNSAGQHVCNITWINNTYMGLSNAYECDGEYDSKRWDAERRLDESYAEHGHIDWADVIQKGARDVKDKEKGSGAFTSCCVTKSNCLSSIVAVSGDPRWNGAANIAWTCLARQPLVGIFCPLGASYLQHTDESDIPSELTYGLYGGGMEDYVDVKVYYATNGAGQGSNTYYAEKVREVQNYTFQIENYSFDLYDNYLDSLYEGMPQDTVESMLQNYVNDIVSDMITAYVNEEFIDVDPPNSIPIVSNPNPPNESEGISISFSQLSVNISDSDSDLIYYIIETCPDIGSGSNSDVGNGIYTVSVSGLEYDTTYYWSVNCSDGIHWTNETYSFTTEAINIKPTIEITKPETALYISNKERIPFFISLIIGAVDIEVNASDESGIKKVEFYVDGEFQMNDTSAPYTWLWDERTPLIFKHTIKAIAYDNAGNSNNYEITVWKFF